MTTVLDRTSEHDAGSPEWWRDRLHKRLTDRNKLTVIYDDYYEGEHRLAFATSKFRKIFGDLFKEFADNWCGLVVDAPEERLDVEGFRFGDEEARLRGDTAAWEIWQRNQLDAFSQQAHLEALIYGDASIAVWQENDLAKVTVEHPTQMIVAQDSGVITDRAAALKVWEDEFTGDTFATLYLPDRLYKWRRRGGGTTGLAGGGDAEWKRRQPTGEEWPLPNPLGMVPVVPLVNRPRLLRVGRSEIHDVIPVQDAVNKLVADMMVASEYQAFRQRWATGIDVPPQFDDEGEPLPQDQQDAVAWKHAIDRIWMNEDPDVKFGEFSATDLTPFTNGIEMLVQHIASQSKTPPHYFYLSGQFPSGESIKSAETGLVAKVLRKQRFFGESWEEVMRLGFLIEGDRARAGDHLSETIWADAETRTESEHVDAVIKKASVQVPLHQLWEDLGYSQVQIQRFKAMLADQAAMTSNVALALAQSLDAAGPAPAGNGGEPAAAPAGATIT